MTHRKPFESGPQRVRVALLGPSLEAVSGVSTHLNNILRSGLQDDFEFSHFQVGSEGRDERKWGTPLRLLRSPFSLVYHLLKFRPDIVHINMTIDRKSFPRDAIYLVIAKLARRAVVLQLHGGVPPNELYRSRLLTKFLGLILKSAEMVVLLGSAELERFREFCAQGRYTVIANAIPITRDAPTPRTPDKGALRLVFVGRLIREKGVYECLEAARLLKNEGRDFSLKIAGGGPEEQTLHDRKVALGLDPEVTFLGPVFGAAKDALWRDSDVFVSPTYSEGLPYALLESMALGTVPITTRVGAQPEVIEDSVHGFFVPLRDPKALAEMIARLDEDRYLLSETARRCSLRARERYSTQRLGAELRELYKAVGPSEPNVRHETAAPADTTPPKHDLPPGRDREIRGRPAHAPRRPRILE
jgi:glycosyltransferase involved in cell wall biosynthesis